MNKSGKCEVAKNEYNKGRKKKTKEERKLTQVRGAREEKERERKASYLFI